MIRQRLEIVVMGSPDDWVPCWAQWSVGLEVGNFPTKEAGTGFCLDADFN